jgi:phosphoglycolate phosphatase-like HAD superfamily hydrolase
MRVVGHDDDAIDARMDAVCRRYVQLLEHELRSPSFRPHALPGVPGLLDAVEAHPEGILGLLTGNVVEGARAKLSAVGIEPDRFAVGAFGSDHETRSELPAVAQRRALEQLGVDVRGSDVVIVGDTPNDIDCGRSVGARAIAVATGGYRADELRAHEPHAVFEDLSSTDEVLDAIFRER